MASYSWSTPIVQPRLHGESSALAVGQHVLRNEQIPASWFTAWRLASLQWAGQRLLLPEDPHGTLFQLRATDIPVFPHVTRGKTSRTRTPWAAANALGSMVIVNSDGMNVFGGPTIIPGENRFRFSVELDTQVPALVLINSFMADGVCQTHRVTLHGTTAMQNANYVSPAAVKAAGLGFPIPPVHQKAADEGRLLALTVHFGNSRPGERHLRCITVQHDRQTQTVKDRWTSDADMISKLWGAEDLTGFDHALHLLFTGKDMNVTFLRELDARDIDEVMVKLEAEYNHWAHVMNLSITHGQFWFYRMQPQFAQGQNVADFYAQGARPQPPVPFWLVNDFLATVTQDGLTELRPLHWQHLVRDPNSVFARDLRLLLQPSSR